MRTRRKFSPNYMPTRQEGSICHNYFLPRERGPFICQVVLPTTFNMDDARRLCAFIETLAVDFTPEPGPQRQRSQGG